MGFVSVFISLNKTPGTTKNRTGLGHVGERLEMGGVKWEIRSNEVKMG